MIKQKKIKSIESHYTPRMQNSEFIRKCIRYMESHYGYAIVRDELMFFLSLLCFAFPPNKDGKKLATEHDCKFIETSSGIQHNVDELLVGVLKQIRLREDLSKKRRKKKLMGSGSRTSLSLGVARDILQKMCLQDNRSKSCENLLVL